jgi:excinuclease ABC subunit C
MDTALKTTAKLAPKSPGVYFWRDGKGKVIYVGRATSLKNRLSQYFLKDIPSRTKEMVDTARNLTWENCDTLLQAIIMEAHYIKKYWPKYNVKDRDNRSFIYIVIPKSEWPKPIIIRGHELKRFPEDKNKIFGPYQSQMVVRNALKLIRHVFPYSTCAPGSGHACFDYQIGLCPGACINQISKTQYQKNIRNITMLLSGQRERLMKKLIKDNPKQAKSLAHLQEVSLLAREDGLAEKKINRIEGYDISHFHGKESYGSMVVFSNGEADKNQYRLFKIKEGKPGDDEAALKEVLLRRFSHSEWPEPDIIMIDGGAPQISYISKVFSENNIKTPIIGISKFGGDILVFSKGAGQGFKDMAKTIKPTLLKAREEAHRFANYGRKRGMKIK